MPSSTFSSDHELLLPGRPAPRLLAAAVLLALVFLASIELAWRHWGFVPSARDSLQLWALRREQARGTTDVVVFVGTSRAQLGLDPVMFSRELGGRQTIQLGITGAPALPVLRDLADDEAFRGTVICDVTPASFFLPATEVDTEWPHAWRRLPLITNLETELRLHLQRRLVLLTPETNPRFQLSELLATGAFIHPPLVEMREDRFRAAHYASGDADAMRKRWTERLRTRMRVIDDRELRELSDTVAGWVRRIRARGGEVIFVRIPSSSTVLDAEAELWPRERFWDVFVREAQVKAIYFADEPTLRDIQAAEGSHLDAAEAAEFSAQLARILRARGWIHVRQ